MLDIPSFIVFSVLSDISLHCRTRQSKLTSQTRVLRHQLPSDLPAAAHKQMHNGHNHWLFDIIYFPLGCYRKNLKKPLMIYWCGCTRVCFHSLKQPPLAVDVAIAIAGSYCTLDLDPLENPLPSLQCVMKEIHVVGFASYRSMHGITCRSGVNCCVLFYGRVHFAKSSWKVTVASFVVIWQNLSNYGLTRLKRFVPTFTDKLCN
jgi:hypothetical protein